MGLSDNGALTHESVDIGLTSVKVAIACLSTLSQLPLFRAIGLPSPFNLSTSYPMAQAPLPPAPFRKAVEEGRRPSGLKAEGAEGRGAEG